MPSRIKQLKASEKRTTTPSDLLADLHVYIVPINKWIPFRRLARNQVVEETVSAGFVRVSPATTLLELRAVLAHQLDLDFPQYYVYIRSVGRNFTQVKTHQEPIIKVKHFLPPQANEPEIHVLEVSEDLIKKSGSVPNLLLSDTDFSDHGTGSIVTGRLSQPGRDGNDQSRGHSRLQLPPRSEYYDDNRSYRSQEERLRSYSNGRDPAEGVPPFSKGRNRKGGQREEIERSSDEDEGYANDYKSKPSSTASKNQRHSPMKRKRAIHGNKMNRNSDENNEEERTKTSSPSRRKSEAIGRRPTATPFNDLRRTVSLDVLSRPISQESLAEEEDKMGIGYRDRSRAMSRTEKLGQGRSVSVSALEGNHSLSESYYGTATPQRVRRHSQGDDRYTPHRWRLEREAKKLEYEVRMRQRLMQEELEAMREAQKAEEARRFEEKLRKEEELYNQQGLERSESQNRTEVLNLEVNSPVVEVMDENQLLVKETDLVYPPEGGAKEKQIIGRLVGVKNQGFEITYELEFSNGEEENEDANDRKNKREKSREGRLVKRDGQNDGNEVTLKTRGRENNLNSRGRRKDRRETSEGKMKLEDNNKDKKGDKKIMKREKMNLGIDDKDGKINKGKKNDIDEDERLTLGRKYKEKNLDGDLRNKEKHKSKSSLKYQTTKGAWGEQAIDNSKNLQTESQIEVPFSDANEDPNHQGKDGRGKNELKKMNTSNHRKKISNAAFKKDRAIPKENIEDVRKEKEMYEDSRTRLFSRAKALHEQILTIREKKRQKWWDDYNLARRKGTRLEERQANLRQELETLYRRVLGSLIKRQPLITGVRDEPSRKASYKISVIRLRHEIADLLRRVEAIDIKLQAELRLRQQAEREVKQLRSEVSRKKANVALSQSRTPLLRNIAYIPDDILIRL